MSSMKIIAILVACLGLTACASVENSTRNASLVSEAVNTAPLSINVQAVRVIVPETLTVSEANLYYPGGDIVWREDPAGDRHAQVKAIVETAMARGTPNIPKGNVPVIMDVQITRFHALSQKARYTIGGVHAIQFAVILRNPETGTILGSPRHVRADFKALGGAEALTAERNGITQKSRIIEHLAEVIVTEMSNPEGYQAAKLGLLGAINQM